MHKLPRLRCVSREQYLITECLGKKVLHLGAVDYNGGRTCGLHRMLMEVADCVVGIDIDKVGIEQAEAEGIHNILFGDLERLEELNISSGFDVILAGEILEHLSNPGLFLEGVKRFFSSRTKMILTTPDAFSFHRFFFALRGFEYVHPNHVCYYSLITLRYLLESHGFVIEDNLVYALDSRLRTLRIMLCRINWHFANGLILVTKI